VKIAGASALLAALVASCEPTSPPETRRAANALVGTVRLAEGVVAEPTQITNTTDPEVCGDGQTLEDLLLSRDRGIQNVIVSVRDAPAVAAEAETLILDNVECRFEPHAAVITAGSTIEARNSDAVLHTTHLYGPREMNFSLPVQGMTSSRTLNEPGIYAVKCDVHGWMQAYIRVDDHPFHAVTDTDGRFRIEGLPAGSYTLELWHERLGPLEREVELTVSAPSSIEIEFPP
jgi:plastocyanin